MTLYDDAKAFARRDRAHKGVVPMFTKRHYEFLAAFCHSRPGAGYLNVHQVLALADALAADNPRFNRQRFLAAAGVQEPPLACPYRTVHDTSNRGL